MKLVTTELNEFFEIYPRSEKTYNTFIRGLAAMGEYQKAKEALIDMRVSIFTDHKKYIHTFKKYRIHLVLKLVEINVLRYFSAL
jgi:pentatricopeptide repeat protein